MKFKKDSMITLICSCPGNSSAKTVSFNEFESSKIRNIKVLLFFKYGIDSKVRMKINTIGVIDIDTPNGFSSIKVEGDLKFKQRSPIQSTKKPFTQYYYGDNEEKLLGSDEMHQNSPYDFLKIFEYYQSNNFTTTYDYNSIIVPGSDNNKECKLEATIDIPSFQKFVYYPPISQMVKEAWNQYFYLFIVIYILVRLVLIFLMEHKLFSCQETGELLTF